MNTTAERRDVKFDHLDQIVDEANRLLNEGYESVGKWDLSQVAGHCECWLRYPMDGFPKAGFPVNMMLWMMKKTIGKGALKKILDSKSMKEGQPTMPESVPQSDAKSDSDAVAKLTETVNRFKDFDGEFHGSPIFGDMDRETLTNLHLVHCAHHFSFLSPKSNDE